MAHAHESNTKRIWIVFGILSVITIVEVLFGIYKPKSLFFTNFLGMNLLNWLFIILTIVKAYYITWAFMHMEGEKKWFRRSIVWTVTFLILYLCFILLVEGDYVYEVFKTGHLKWIF
ncbi:MULTISPECIES: cytochrome C oxidase subunit IV family protein [Flavobacterium]|jgi:cytochrome c oxidase subunit IV|uniref:Cytochrome c oxidase subunit IV n=3 Tax=Flavobacterium TaxID=237 RepID=A0A562KLK1_9FLAO|nr:MULTISPECIES: cytochrome C oxidase subunit IV family protein [Flavobacterium]MCW1147161.1 cytochrome C oxidase subunit IV family protein [Flavobacterium lacisediminis]TDR24179.1 cytochrome c oxidase subunit IV [Flavobacterium cheniae]TWH96299.1 cytochrome c oxidase subunit IV [Flavobacterium cheniae]